MKDRRTFERFATKILADVFEPGSFRKIGKANIFNMSTGGAGIEAGFLLNKGQELILRFHLKKHKYDFSRLLIEGEVEIRWASLDKSRRFYGVKFLKVPTADRHRIKEYLEFIKEKRGIK